MLNTRFRTVTVLVAAALALSAFAAQLSPEDARVARAIGTQPGDVAVLNALRTELEQRVAADTFGGAVLLARGERVIYSGAHGFADRERQVPNTRETRFRIGSMNKMFTAVAVLTLVQAGRISLHEPIGRYLRGYPNSSAASTVTVHHLLTHTGGTGDIFGPQFSARRLSLRTHQDYVELFGARDLLFEPGSRWMYSNYGFVLLGAIIEQVSGQTYYDYVRQHVYAPARMTSTGSEPEDRQVPNRAIGYMMPGGATGWRANSGTLPYRGTAAGGGYTTIGDLQRFANALTSYKLLDRKHTALATTGTVAAPGGQYAYGFMDVNRGGRRAVGHSGGAPGMNGELLIFPDSGYVIAVLANMDPPAATRLAQFIASRLPAP